MSFTVALLQQSPVIIEQETKEKPQVTKLLAENSYTRAGDMSVIMTNVGLLVKYPHQLIASHLEKAMFLIIEANNFIRGKTSIRTPQRAFSPCLIKSVKMRHGLTAMV